MNIHFHCHCAADSSTMNMSFAVDSGAQTGCIVQVHCALWVRRLGLSGTRCKCRQPRHDAVVFCEHEHVPSEPTFLSVVALRAFLGYSSCRVFEESKFDLQTGLSRQSFVSGAPVLRYNREIFADAGYFIGLFDRRKPQSGKAEKFVGVEWRTVEAEPSSRHAFQRLLITLADASASFKQHTTARLKERPGSFCLAWRTMPDLRRRQAADKPVFCRDGSLRPHYASPLAVLQSYSNADQTCRPFKVSALPHFCAAHGLASLGCHRREVLVWSTMRFH